jgi:Cys-tRNA(Pro)/Cys-tRNA(Cys) deacylase
MSTHATEGELPDWLAALRRDLLEPYRQLAVRQEFYLQLQRGSLARELLERYVLDTQWAVHDFARIAKDMADRAPSFYHTQMELIAKEEQGHPRMLGHVLHALGLDPSGILAENGRYRPTPFYELWWRFIQHCARDLAWEDGVAAVMVGIEDLARVQEAIVGKALVEHYGLSAHQAAWYIHHGGEEEAEHGGLGLQMLARAIDPDDAGAHARVRQLIERAAAPLLFHYPNHLLGRPPILRGEGSLDSPAAQQLSALGIDYRLVPHAKGVRSAEDFARAAGIPLARVFKTLLFDDGRGEHILLICPTAERVDLDLLGRQLGAQPTLAKRQMVSAVTGYEPSSVSPFGIERQLTLYADARLFHGDRVYLGSGAPGVDIELSSLAVLEGLRPICIEGSPAC